jgi:hypothetical protein
VARARARESDFTGRRGEAIAFARLTEVCRKNDLPYFQPIYLGEKCPTFDFLVQLVGAGRQTPFFFAQVKATRRPLTKRHSRLRVKVSAEDVRRMATCLAPAYVVGVHETQERAFVVSVHGGMRDAIASLTTAHELNRATLRRLWEEVRDFWRGRDMARADSSFTNEVQP